MPSPRDLHVYVRDKLSKERSWQVRDLRGQWVCPFCTESSAVQVGRQIDRGTLDGIATHVAGCAQFARAGASGYKSFDQVRKAVVARAEREKLAQEVAARLEGEEVWRVTLPGGQWVCPFCREGVKTIRIAVPLDWSVNAPPRISEHLISECPGYGKREPATDPVRLLQRARGENAGPDTLVEPGHKTESGGWKSVESELERKAFEMTEQMLHGIQESERELARASAIQRSMFPRPPEVPGFELQVIYEPSDALGGDFYDFVKLPDGRVGIALGDVTGHGVTAALVMGMGKKALNICARHAATAKQAITMANEEIVPDLDGKTFITIAYAVLDPARARLSLVRAGHEPLQLYNPIRRPSYQTFRPQGAAAGLVAGERFVQGIEELELALVPGDICFLYTDGVTESMNPAGEEFGAGRMAEAVTSGPAEATLEQVFREIRRAVLRFASGRALADDFTLVGFRYRGPTGGR